ncbi:MAG: hypothetical protein EOP85_13200, partial [Verrucomicrobiaceae bacterium]
SLSRLTNQSPGFTQSLLLGVTAAVIVAAFQTVGAVMAVALLVLPAASALLVSRRLPRLLAGVIVHSVLSAVGGMYLATSLNCNLGASVIISGAILFCGCWVFTNLQGNRHIRA